MVGDGAACAAAVEDDPVTAVGVQRVTIGGVSTALPERMTLPAMGSFVILLYGVDVLFGDSPAAPWFEFILAGSLLLLGRDTLRRGVENLVYKLQPDLVGRQFFSREFDKFFPSRSVCYPHQEVP